MNTGLAVNEVAADGGASEPGDVLVLAPQTTGLAEEDLLTQPTAEADELRPGEIEAATQVALGPTTPASLGTEATDPIEVTQSTTPMTADQVLALADQIAAGVEPLEALEDLAVVAPTLSVDGSVVEDAIQIIPTSVPGVTTAFRPPARPASLVVTQAQAQGAVPSVPDVDVSAIEALVAEAQTTEVARTAPVALGDTLVQLGAFDTMEEAQNAWSVLSARFSDYMVGKEIVVQEATSGGSPFYRLRAMGFAGIEDARRFCAALQAEQAACIPVVVQ